MLVAVAEPGGPVLQIIEFIEASLPPSSSKHFVLHDWSPVLTKDTPTPQLPRGVSNHPHINCVCVTVCVCVCERERERERERVSCTKHIIAETGPMHSLPTIEFYNRKREVCLGTPTNLETKLGIVQQTKQTRGGKKRGKGPHIINQLKPLEPRLKHVLGNE